LTFRRAFLFGAGFGLLLGFIVAAYMVGSNAKARAVNCAAVTSEAQLQCVTRETNSQIVWADDFTHYGVNDVWVENPADGHGDCEDYVLTKARKLEALGWSAARMSMAIFPYAGGTHAVLLIDDTYVLDNLSPWVGRWKDYYRKPKDSYSIAFARSLARFKSLPALAPAGAKLASAR
jgi:predicted transglutaminase-like cysteine proteinase